MEYTEDIEQSGTLNSNSEKGALLMQQALKKYAEGDFEGGEIDREKANKYFDLAKMEINAESNNISQLYGENRNFGIVYKVLESNFTNAIQDRKISKTPLIEALKQVKKNKQLNEQFKVYNAFSNPQNVVDAEEYVNEVISLSSKYNQKELNIVNENLINFIQSKNINELVDINDEDLELFESINYVITNTKNIKNINDFIQHKNTIVEYVQKHNTNTTINEDVDTVFNQETSVLEEKYDSILNDDEKAFIKEYTTLTSKEECFESNKKQLVSLIEKKIMNADKTTVEYWTELHNKVNESSFNEKTFIVDLAKIIEIKNNLE